MEVSIKSCPIKFHDIVEIFDFLSNLSPSLLYSYQFAEIMFDDVSVMYIMIYYVDGRYLIGYKTIQSTRTK